jgi:pSer/pThr/pTyr-binding forkhead associated (FHA) protein
MPMLIALSLNDPNAQAKPYDLSDKAYIIGRHADCALRLDHISVSRQHAKIHHLDNAWHIQDLHSRNGTYRNGRRLQSEELRESDIIHIGDCAIVYSERPVESFITMDSWLQRIRQKAADLSMQIYIANTNPPVTVPVTPSAPLSAHTTKQGKIVRTKPSDILKSPAYQGTATLPTLQRSAATGTDSGLPFITTPPLQANHQPQVSR